ncbi:MAG TPA: hypothetical protein VFL96_08750 [Acidobacteriaceae bacterium]|nr:hypothetical protein [Acidobacteriaceae bacterium]
MEEKRARRRRDLLRMKAKAIRVYGRWDIPGFDPKRHAKLANHMAHCSGSCCGNPRRKWKELTMQERRFLAEEVNA